MINIRGFLLIPKILDAVIHEWATSIEKSRLIITPDPPAVAVREISKMCLGVMRHQADIPILTAAILADARVILSGNREHFNTAVAQRCGIHIYSCTEFIAQLKN